MKHHLPKRLLTTLLVFCLFVSLAGCSGAGKNGTHALNVPDDNCRTYYEIFVRSFYDSDGNGVGDLNGITQKLDYLNDGDDKTDTDLGFNGIWLMPVMPSPSYHKYDVTDYTAIDPVYGTLEDFQALLDACHARGIRLIIDFVFNHTSAKHPWFLQAVDYYKTLAPGAKPDYGVCAYAGYYHFSTDKKGASGWYRVGNTEWYYEGKFWDQMPDLALENEQVRRELESAASFWLNMGVDGFRLDAVKEYVSGSPESNIEILSWFSDYVTSVNPNAYLVGEAWETNAVGLSAYYKSGITSLFDFPVSQATGGVSTVIKSESGEKLASLLTRSKEAYGAVNPNFIDAPFLSNHDTSRVSAQYVNDSRKMKLAAGLLLTMDGSPFVYYGEEIGMNSMGKKDENKRLPMHWSDTDTAGTPFPPSGADSVEQKFPALDVQMSDPLSLYSYYKSAIRIRNKNPELARGTVEVVPALTSGSVCAVTKTYNEKTILVCYNIGETGVSLALGDTEFAKYKLYNSLMVDETAVTFEKSVLTLPPYAIAVLRPKS
ncbi:MAG: alpha-amylase family glycosyl hydrolase [Clostridiaceae bacterium]